MQNCDLGIHKRVWGGTERTLHIQGHIGENIGTVHRMVLHRRLSICDKHNWTYGDKYQGNRKSRTHYWEKCYDCDRNRLYLRKPPITGTYPSLYFRQHLFDSRSSESDVQQDDCVFHRFGEAEWSRHAGCSYLYVTRIIWQASNAWSPFGLDGSICCVFHW